MTKRSPTGTHRKSTARTTRSIIGENSTGTETMADETCTEDHAEAAEAPDVAEGAGQWQAEIEHLVAELATAKADLARAAEEKEELRLERAAAEATALDEFKLRIHLENDRMLSDSNEKALRSEVELLRRQIDRGVAREEQDGNSLNQMKAELERTLERERAAQAQLSSLAEALAQAHATIEQLEAHSHALQERLAAMQEEGARRRSWFGGARKQ
jgi:chromosome segregation ATPase